MLPFLKPKPQGAIIVEERKPDQNQEPDDQEAPLKSCAQDLIHAVSMKDVDAAAAAIRAAFEILDSEPHEEGSHTNEMDQE